MDMNVVSRVRHDLSRQLTQTEHAFLELLTDLR